MELFIILVVGLFLGLGLKKQKTTKKSNSIGSIAPNIRKWGDAKNSGETELSFGEWEKEVSRKERDVKRQRRLEVGIQKEKVKRHCLERDHRTCIGEEDLGISPEEEVLFIRQRQLEERLSLIGDRSSVKEGETPEESRRKNAERYAIYKNDYDQLEKDWSNLYIQVRDDYFSEQRIEIESENVDRPYRLEWTDSAPGGRYPYASGRWTATSTKWGLKIYDGVVHAFNESDPSKNAALVFLYKKIGERIDKTLLPFNPMDSDC